GRLGAGGPGVGPRLCRRGRRDRPGRMEAAAVVMHGCHHLQEGAIMATIATALSTPLARASMVRVRYGLGAHRGDERRQIAEAHAILSVAFPDYADQTDYITRKLVDQTARGFPAILLVAHDSGDHVAGFALADYFEPSGFAYLDFIVTRTEQRGRGLGGA